MKNKTSKFEIKTGSVCDVRSLAAVEPEAKGK